MKKLILTFALAAGFMTVQAQDDSKSVSGDSQKESKTEQPALDKDATKKSSTDVGSPSGSSTGTSSSGSDKTLTTPATPADTTRKDRKPENE